MALDPEIIEKLRENSHIRLDREGRFWHEGAPVEHPLVAQAFHRGLGRAPDGRPTITFGRTWCYFTADGALYQARTAACVTGPGGTLQSCVLRLDDATDDEVLLVPGSIGIDHEGVLHVRVKEGREWARLLPAAQAELGRWVETSASGELGLLTGSGFVLPVRIG
jgi:hypothetical protein